MEHSVKKRMEVLNLVNKGLSFKEISKQTKVTEKTVSKWFKNWYENDKPKKDVIDSLWKRLLDLSNEKELKIVKIKQLTHSIKEMQKELLIFSKYINL